MWSTSCRRICNLETVFASLSFTRWATYFTFLIFSVLIASLRLRSSRRRSACFEDHALICLITSLKRSWSVLFMTLLVLPDTNFSPKSDVTDSLIFVKSSYGWLWLISSETIWSRRVWSISLNLPFYSSMSFWCFKRLSNFWKASAFFAVATYVSVWPRGPISKCFTPL